MIARFALYGFLKNQRYFEPFLALALLSRGTSFFDIGVLIGVREVVRNLLEIPSGAIADIYGRKRAMVLAFLAYPIGAVVLADAVSMPMLCVAMSLLGVGDAFRSGTHKAMIFSWLARHDRADSRSEVYGFTRSWSQLGSALSIPVSVAIVLLVGDYRWLFWATCVPWAMNLVNLATYPAFLNQVQSTKRGPLRPGQLLSGTVESLRTRSSLRALIVNAMAFEGVHKATKELLAPALLLAAGVITTTAARGQAGFDWARVAAEPSSTSALVIGAGYLVVHLFGALSARKSHLVVRRMGTESDALTVLARALVVVLALVAVGGWIGPIVLALALSVIPVLHNLYRPALVAYIDSESDEESKATVLSIESQASSIAAVALAPLVGATIEWASVLGGPSGGLGAAGLVGLLVLSPFLWRRPVQQTSRRRHSAEP